MAGGKSIFGKAIGLAAGLLGTGHAAAEAPDTAAPAANPEADKQRELESLRLVVREAGYAEQRNRILAERGAQADDAIFSTPYAAGLELVVVADRETSSSAWMQRDLTQYKVTQDEAIALARRQVLAVLPTLPPKDAVAGGVVMVPKMDYLASLMLADGWDDLDRALGGKLIVAVPSDDVLIVADATAPDIRAKLPEFVQQQHADANRSVSPLLYRRADGRWVAAD